MRSFCGAPTLNRERFSSGDLRLTFSFSFDPGAWFDQQAGVEWQDWTNCDSLMISNTVFYVSFHLSHDACAAFCGQLSPMPLSDDDSM